MIRVLINAAGIKVGGGLKDLANTVPLLATHPSLEVVLAMNAGKEVEQACSVKKSTKLIVVKDGLASRFWWELCGIKKAIKKNKIDVVLHFANYCFTRVRQRQIVVLRSIKPFTSMNLVSDCSDGVRDKLRNELSKLVSRMTVNNADAVIAVSETMGKAVERISKKAAQKTTVCYLGADEPKSPLGELEARILNASTTGTKKIVALVTSPYKHKGILVALQAMKEVVDATRDIKLILTAGIYACRDKKWKQEKALIKELSSTGCVQDMGRLSNAGSLYLIAKADALIFPSTMESFGHPLLEAMREGTRIVASNIEINREICQNEACYFDAGDYRALAKAIIHVCMIEKPEKRSLHIQAGKKRALNFLWQNHVNQLVNVIKRVDSNESTSSLPKCPDL